MCVARLFANSLVQLAIDVLSMAEMLGGSAQTFWGVVHYARRHNVRIALLENSDTLATASGLDSDQPSYCTRMVGIFKAMGMSSLNILPYAAIFGFMDIIELRKAAPSNTSSPASGLDDVPAQSKHCTKTTWAGHFEFPRCKRFRYRKYAEANDVMQHKVRRARCACPRVCSEFVTGADIYCDNCFDAWMEDPPAHCDCTRCYLWLGGPIF